MRHMALFLASDKRDSSSSDTDEIYNHTQAHPSRKDAVPPGLIATRRAFLWLLLGLLQLKRIIRHGSHDLLASHGHATAALSIPQRRLSVWIGSRGSSRVCGLVDVVPADLYTPL
jgi:hypothetical protein